MLTISKSHYQIYVNYKRHWAFELFYFALPWCLIFNFFLLSAQLNDETITDIQSLTLIQVDEVLPFLAVSGATILGPLHYVCARANVVADGEAFKATLAVPDGLSRLTDLLREVQM